MLGAVSSTAEFDLATGAIECAAVAGATTPRIRAAANATPTMALPQDVERRLERWSSVTMVPARIERGFTWIASPSGV